MTNSGYLFLEGIGVYKSDSTAAGGGSGQSDPAAGGSNPGDGDGGTEQVALANQLTDAEL